jgi:Amt family ammonium transporter
MIRSSFLSTAGLAGLAMAAAAAPALAQDAAATAVPADSAYVFNTFSFLVTGFLVMWMAAGFAMLEAGMVRTKNVAMQCTKNIALYSIAGLMFWVIGYNLMYDGVDGGYLGSFTPKMIPAPDNDAGDYSAASDWFFQMVFCATAASIVSGTLAERIRLWPFLVFTAVLCGVIYPIQGAWQWGGGWLSEAGFSDFAGSTIVHSTGGWAALTGAIILGSRAGKYGSGGIINPMPGSSMPLATLGTFILWLGWFGFNGGSQLALGSIEDASSIARIFVNTNLAAAAGVVAALILTQVVYGKVDLTMALNGALAGLVSITAEPLMPDPIWAIMIGGIGGAIVVFAVPLLDRLRIDDVVGAIPVHLLAGIWGTIAVPLTNDGTSFATQLLGIAAIGLFVSVVSGVLWLAMKATIGIRVSAEEEFDGLDKSELGMEAYPEFGQGTQRV